MNTPNYWVSVWARLRQDEVIPLPQDYAIHTDFTAHAGRDEIKDAFLQIHSFFVAIYGDIADQPDSFGMPLHLIENYRVFSTQWRDSAKAPYQPMILLFNLFTCGEFRDGAVYVPVEKYNGMIPLSKDISCFSVSRKIKKPHVLFRKLADYGFTFEGLKDYKAANQDIVISYPDNTILLRLFKMLADKAGRTGRLGDFLCCHFRLLQDDMNTAAYGLGADDVADRVHTEAEKQFVLKMDETLTEAGLFGKLYGGVECHGIAYYRTQKDTQKPYIFRMVTRSFDIESNVREIVKMQLSLRIRNVSNCLAYLESCPESVKELFRYGDSGCKNRPCKSGVEYEFEGHAYWRCGCCHSSFVVKPVAADIPHYIKLVELGEKK